jgi:hypothetical protein
MFIVACFKLKMRKKEENIQKKVEKKWKKKLNKFSFSLNMRKERDFSAAAESCVSILDD